MTFTIEGDDVDNQIEVSQSAADDSSTLTCTPECPQKEPGQYDEYGGGEDFPDYSGGSSSSGGNPPAPSVQQQEAQPRIDEYGFADDYDDSAEPRSASPADQLAPGIPTKLNKNSCPGGNIKACIDSCPSNPLVAFKACVTQCSKRCP